MNKRIFSLGIVTCVLLGHPFAANALECADIPKCTDMGYETGDFNTCSKTLSCPFDTAYKKCLDADYNLDECPQGLTCEKKYKVSEDSCPTLSDMTSDRTLDLIWDKDKQKCTKTILQPCSDWENGSQAFSVTETGDDMLATCNISLNGCNNGSGYHVNKYSITTNGWELVEENKCKLRMNLGNSSPTINLEGVKTFYVANIENDGDKNFQFIIEECNDGYTRDGNNCIKPVEPDEICIGREGYPYHMQVLTKFTIDKKTYYELYQILCCKGKSSMNRIGNVDCLELSSSISSRK